MTTASAGPIRYAPTPTRPRLRRWELLAGLLTAAVLGALSVQAFDNSRLSDFGAFYNGASQAWLRGNPWLEPNHDLTPGATLLLAPLTALHQTQAAQVFTFANIILAACLLAAAFVWLRARTSPWFAWMVTFALAAWAPLVGSIWWRQLNLLALAPGVAGFALARRRPGWAGVLIGLSLAIKPLLLVLPLFLFAARQTRRAALIAAVTGGVLTACGLGALAWHGGSANPWAYYQAFNHLTGTPARGWLACHQSNYSALSLACQAFGDGRFSEIRLLVTVTLLALIFAVGLLLRHAVPGSLVILAWAGLLSPLLSPLAFHHELVFLAPMVLWIAAEAFAAPRRVVLWVGLVIGWLLTQLVWVPAMSLPAQLSGWLAGRAGPADEMVKALHPVAAAPWVLAVTGGVACMPKLRRRGSSVSRESPQRSDWGVQARENPPAIHQVVNRDQRPSLNIDKLQDSVRNGRIFSAEVDQT